MTADGAFRRLNLPYLLLAMEEIWELAKDLYGKPWKMSTEHIEELRNWAVNVVGKPCWRVSAGPSTGSRFILHVGDKIPRERKVENPRLTQDQCEFFGQFRVIVGCAAWRLESKDRVLTAWTDSAALGGPIISKLEELVGRKVTGASVAWPGLDLIMEFDGELCLRVFCDQMEDDFDNYAVSIKNRFLKIGTGSSLTGSLQSDSV